MLNNKKILVKPKDAATVIIIKKEKNKSFVLMGQRPLKSRFMPGVYVFPGGVYEKEDSIATKYFNLPRINLSKKKIKTRSKRHSKALLLTAVRETAEETGLYLASRNNINKKIPLNMHKTWLKFVEKSYSPAIDKLIFFGRAITPSTLKMRFHARFFIAFSKDFLGKLHANKELENLDWFSLEDAKKKKIADVTEFMLNEIIKLDNKYENIFKNKWYPMFTWRFKKRWIKWEKIN